VKVPFYARHGIAEAWLVDLGTRLLQIHRAPASGGYTQSSVIAVPGVLQLAALPAVAVDLSRLLGF
jgi:Uma2 family endonuclease